jgi:hypothetical protein
MYIAVAGRKNDEGEVRRIREGLIKIPWPGTPIPGPTD